MSDSFDPPPKWRQVNSSTVKTFVRFRDTSLAIKKSNTHSRRISRLKRLLPLIAGLALVGLILWPLWKTPKISEILATNVPGLIIENLHYTGVDSKAQPYSLSAKKAIQANALKTLVDLEKPEAEITLETGAWVSGRALKGQYDQNRKKLFLSDQVEVFRDDGHQLIAQDLQIDFNSNEVISQKPIIILGDFGKIEGNGLFIKEKQDVVIIQGPATLSLKKGP